MRFGRIPVGEAEGAILAHAQRPNGQRLAKGRRLSAADVRLLGDAGLSDVTVAVLEDGDLDENEAAARIGLAAANAGIAAGPAGTGRVNFFAGASGLLLPDRASVDALNAIDPGITLATLGEFASVEAGGMVATVKIIPLAVRGPAVEAACRLLRDAPPFRLAPYRGRDVVLIQTELPGVKPSVLDKTRAVLERRLASSGSRLVRETRCAHDTGALADVFAGAIDAEMTIVFGASAVIDGEDVIPAAVRMAGGEVRHLGMPVDPGNLLLLGRFGTRPVLGAPGCARSPKENGFDWVLNRLMADLEVTGQDIARMGVGGLLGEIASRPQPRDRAEPSGIGRPRVDVVVLAAGRSSRMNGPNKLLAGFDGVSLIRKSVLTALASRAGAVRVVLGHRSEDLKGALAGLDVELIGNPRYAEGLASSLIAGFEASKAADGVLVLLADQPLLTAAHLDSLIDAFRPSGEGSIVLACDGGRRGNPVVLSTGYRAEIAALAGDVGARSIVAANPEAVREVEIGPAASLDVDTPEALALAGGIFA